MLTPSAPGSTAWGLQRSMQAAMKAASSWGCLGVVHALQRPMQAAGQDVSS